MAFDVEIRCIRKSDRKNAYERINGVGGVNPDGGRWYLSTDQAIQGIKDDKYRFFTNSGGKIALVQVAIHEDHEYLKTEADGVQPNNLLSLDECP